MEPVHTARAEGPLSLAAAGGFFRGPGLGRADARRWLGTPRLMRRACLTSRGERPWIAQDGPREARSQVEPPRHGLDEAAVRSGSACAHAAVCRFRTELHPPTDARGESLDAGRADTPQDLVEVVSEHALLLGGGRPQARVADSLRAIGADADGDPEDSRQLRPDPGRLPFGALGLEERYGADERRLARHASRIERDRLELDADGRKVPGRDGAAGRAERALEELADLALRGDRRAIDAHAPLARERVDREPREG